MKSSNIFLQSYQANFNRTWHKTFWGDADSGLFKWQTKLFLKSCIIVAFLSLYFLIGNLLSGERCGALDLLMCQTWIGQNTKTVVHEECVYLLKSRSAWEYQYFA